MPEQIIRQRSVEDSLGYFVTVFTERAADTDDIELGGIAIALGMTVARAKDELTRLRADLEQAKAGPGAAELAGRLNSAEAQLRAVDQRYGSVHEAVDAWRTGELDSNQAMRRIAQAVGRAA